MNDETYKILQAKYNIWTFCTKHDKVKELYFFIYPDKKFLSYILQVHNDGRKRKTKKMTVYKALINEL